MINIKQGTFFVTEPSGKAYEIFEPGQWDDTLEIDLNENPDFVCSSLGNLKDMTFTATLKTTKDQYFRMIDTFTGLFKMICELCPNKRVIYLATHGKKRRTRKKNRQRAIRILEEGRNHG